MTRAAVAVVLAILLSGCVAHKPAPAAPSEADVQVGDPVQRTVATGSIEGVVTDDEVRPLSHATVTLTSPEATVATGPDGAFAFRNVPVGHHTLLAVRDGFGQTVAKANVTEGEAAKVEIRMPTLIVDRPSIEVVPHTVLHHVGFADADQAAQTLGQGATCEACVMNLTAFAPPDHLVVEVFGKHAVHNPLGDAEYVRVVNVANGTAITQGNRRLPVYLDLNATALKGATSFQLWFLCESSWVCEEERRDVWVSVFYGQEVPEGYTANPAPA